MKYMEDTTLAETPHDMNLCVFSIDLVMYDHSYKLRKKTGSVKQKHKLLQMAYYDLIKITLALYNKIPQ